MNGLAFATIAEIGARLRSGELTVPALTQLMLDRIDALNPKLNCYVTVLHERALAEAERLQALLDAGTDLGPLHGIPIALKDNMATAGIRTTVGSRLKGEWFPEADSTVAARLAAAGTVLLGKLNMYEFAFGGVHPDRGETHNPWNLERACGASSSGSGSAVAAGLAFAALGSDTGGSIRLPAAACGVIGLKPTYGVVSRAGVVPASYSLDHVGPLTRTAEDALLIMAALAGPDPADPATSMKPLAPADKFKGLAGLKVGLVKRQASELIDQASQAAFDQAIQVLVEAGAVTVEIELPDHLLSRTIMWVLGAAEMAEQHRRTIRTQPGEYSDFVRDIIRQGEFIPATEYVHALRVRSAITRQTKAAMQAVDVVAMPVVPMPAWVIGTDTVTIADQQDSLLGALTRYCPPANVTSQPAVALPIGFDGQGLPLAMQFVGHWHDDLALLDLAARYARAAQLPARLPPHAIIGDEP